MNYSEDFRYDELKIFSQDGKKYCKPVWAYQSNLNLRVDNEGIEENTFESFTGWAESKIFPLKCAFELPDGVYSSFLFRICEDKEKSFERDNSYYLYKGKNPVTEMKLPIEDCPFDEVLPVPRQENEGLKDLALSLQFECAHLQSLIEGHINEVGMRRMPSGRLRNINLTFQKYLYN